MASHTFCRRHMVQFPDNSSTWWWKCILTYLNFKHVWNVRALLCIHFFKLAPRFRCFPHGNQSKCWISFRNFTGCDITLCNFWALNSATAHQEAKSFSTGFIISSRHVSTSLQLQLPCRANVQVKERNEFEFCEANNCKPWSPDITRTFKGSVSQLQASVESAPMAWFLPRTFHAAPAPARLIAVPSAVSIGFPSRDPHLQRRFLPGFLERSAWTRPCQHLAYPWRRSLGVQNLALSCGDDDDDPWCSHIPRAAACKLITNVCASLSLSPPITIRSPCPSCTHTHNIRVFIYMRGKHGKTV